MRYSIASLLGLITITAVFSAAAQNGSAEWVKIAYTILDSWVLSAVLVAILGHKSIQAFGIGVSLFGGMYLVMSGHISDAVGSSNFIHSLAFELAQTTKTLRGIESIQCLRAMIGFFYSLFGGFVGLGVYMVCASPKNNVGCDNQGAG